MPEAHRNRSQFRIKGKAILIVIIAIFCYFALTAGLWVGHKAKANPSALDIIGVHVVLQRQFVQGGDAVPRAHFTGIHRVVALPREALARQGAVFRVGGGAIDRACFAPPINRRCPAPCPRSATSTA